MKRNKLFNNLALFLSENLFPILSIILIFVFFWNGIKLLIFFTGISILKTLILLIGIFTIISIYKWANIRTKNYYKNILKGGK